MFINNRKLIRIYELRSLAKMFPKRSRVLEIGAGTGLQAKLLTNWGHDVKAIDISNGVNSKNALFPIEVYDGKNLCFTDESFDVVYSSCVLEHVEDLKALLSETKRVQKTEGCSIHILPTSVWRFWTSVTHYAVMPRRVAEFYSKWRNPGLQGDDRAGPIKKKITLRRFWNFLHPVKHGTKGNFITELYHFSEHRWQRQFLATGFTVKQFEKIGIFYTGHCFFGRHLTLDWRRKLSPILGSSAMMFLLEKRNSKHK